MQLSPLYDMYNCQTRSSTPKYVLDVGASTNGETHPPLGHGSIHPFVNETLTFFRIIVLSCGPQRGFWQHTDVCLPVSIANSNPSIGRLIPSSTKQSQYILTSFDIVDLEVLGAPLYILRLSSVAVLFDVLKSIISLIMPGSHSGLKNIALPYCLKMKMLLYV